MVVDICGAWWLTMVIYQETWQFGDSQWDIRIMARNRSQQAWSWCLTVTNGVENGQQQKMVAQAVAWSVVEGCCHNQPVLWVACNQQIFGYTVYRLQLTVWLMGSWDSKLLSGGTVCCHFHWETKLRDDDELNQISQGSTHNSLKGWHVRLGTGHGGPPATTST